jgi:hypothetical protein
MIVSRPVNDKEPDLLTGNEHKDLIINDLSGLELERRSCPKSGWTHDLLEPLGSSLNAEYPDGWDVYLDKQFIGSSEV